MAIPDRVKQARSMWTYNGRERPHFAIPPGDDQESVWDYPRPPSIVPDEREVIVSYQGIELANTKAALRICETASPPTFYLPAGDVCVELLSRSEGHSFCEWKGQAIYWSLTTGEPAPQGAIGWSYEQLFPEYEAIRGHFSFYPGRVDCYVGGHAVKPQPGGFYGGWITPELVGPFKGESGTSGW